MRKRLVCAALVLVMMFTGCGAAADIRAPERPAPSPMRPIEKELEPSGFTPVPVYLDGLLVSRGYQRGSSVYISIRPLCMKAGVPMSWNGDMESFSLALGELLVDGRAGRQYFIASGRYIFAPEDWMIRSGELYLPEWALCKLLNLTAAWEGGSLLLDGKNLKVLEGGEDYYDLNFPYEDIHWLSHIIGSEAGIEPLEGKIAVGNVVLNRVKDPDFPDTVFGVVYDYEHTIQFEPVSKGTIHDDPKPDDVIAAYLVLEGANLIGDCIYFVNPDFGSFWFDNNLEFVIKVGRHNFYVSKDYYNAGTDAGTDSAAGA